MPKKDVKPLGKHVRIEKHTFAPSVSGVHLINSERFKADLDFALKEANEQSTTARAATLEGK